MKSRENNASRMKATPIAKIRPHAFLIASVLCMAMLISSCSLSELIQPSSIESRLQEIQNASIKPKDRFALVQDLITCVSDNRKTEAVFQSIPAVQKQDISSASFDAYIRALSRLMTDRGQITSYRFLNDTEKKDLIDTIRTSTSSYDALLQETIPIELLFGNEKSIHQPVYIYIQESADGTIYLSDDWITESLKIYDLASLYFYALEEQNRDVVTTLIQSTTSDISGSLSSRVLDYKADKLLSYYHINVKTPFREYRLDSLDISQAVFLQSEVLDDNSLSYQSQKVIFQKSDLGIEIHDNVKTKLDTRHFYLYVDGKRTIRIGDRADANQFRELFGEPIYVGRSLPEDDSVVSELDKELFVVSYQGMSVTVKGNLYDDGSWDGKILRIRLRGQQQLYSIGTDIRTQITRDDILMLYPFADETKYVLETEIDDITYELRFLFSDDADSRVTGTVLELVSDT